MRKKSKKMKINRVTKREEKTKEIKKGTLRTGKWRRGGGKGKADGRRYGSNQTRGPLFPRKH